jgi:II/X family phage/plasmid replication protein
MSELDQSTWYLNHIDITYFSRASSQSQVMAFINSLHSVSYGQVKSRTGYNGTAYFGKKNSRLKKIKVYAKLEELLANIDKIEKRPDGQLLIETVYTPELLAWSEKMVRWELSLYHRYLERRGIDCNVLELLENRNLSEKKLIKLWQEGMKDLFKAFEGKEMKTINDDQIRQDLVSKFTKYSVKTGKASTAYADSAFRTYLLIKEKGWLNAQSLMTKPTFYRHVSMIHECGLSRAALQNMNGMDDGLNIIPFIRFITVDFSEQFPPWFDQSTLKRVA